MSQCLEFVAESFDHDNNDLYAACGFSTDLIDPFCERMVNLIGDTNKTSEAVQKILKEGLTEEEIRFLLIVFIQDLATKQRMSQVKKMLGRMLLEEA